MSPGRWYGSGASRTALDTVKTAALAPMPSARVSTATAVNEGRRRRLRNAMRRSCMTEVYDGPAVVRPPELRSTPVQARRRIFQRSWSQVIDMRKCLVILLMFGCVHVAWARQAPFPDPGRRTKLASAFPEIDRLLTEFANRTRPRRGVGHHHRRRARAHRRDRLSRRRRRSRRSTPDTVFRIASMTKSFTAMAILKLRDEGKLSLDDPAERYVPELKGLGYPTTDSPRITIRHLLSHADGFPEDNPWGDQQLADTEEQLSRDAARRGSRSRTRPASPTSTRTTASRSSAASSPTSSGMPYDGLRQRANILQAARHDVDDARAGEVPADAPRARLSLGGRAVEGRAAAARRRVRVDGRHADVGQRSRAATSARSSPRGRRATAPRRGRSAVVAARDAAVVAAVRRPRRSRERRAARVQLNAGGYGFGLGISQTCDFRTSSRTAAGCRASAR